MSFPSTPSRKLGDPVEAFTIRHDEILEGGFYDESELLTLISPDFQVKGMFMSSLIARLPSSMREEASATLRKPPRLGRFLPFSDYPQQDFVALTVAVAKQYQGIGLREGLRRVARDDFETLANSTMGKVVVALVDDASSALLKVPEVYRRVVKGQKAVAERLGPDAVRIGLDDPAGYEYSLGQLEGIALAFSDRCQTRVSRTSANHYVFEITA